MLRRERIFRMSEGCIIRNKGMKLSKTKFRLLGNITSYGAELPPEGAGGGLMA